jgi:hypothetical protein
MDNTGDGILSETKSMISVLSRGRRPQSLSRPNMVPPIQQSIEEMKKRQQNMMSGFTPKDNSFSLKKKILTNQ